MSDDLERRLRRRSKKPDGTKRRPTPRELEAADEIARLRAENETLREALATIRFQWAGHAEQCELVRRDFNGKCDCDWPSVAAKCDIALKGSRHE